jgi:hypothetical protein
MYRGVGSGPASKRQAVGVHRVFGVGDASFGSGRESGKGSFGRGQESVRKLTSKEGHINLVLRIPDLILKLNVFTRLIGVISLYQKVDFYAKNNDNNKYFPIICTPWA